MKSAPASTFSLSLSKSVLSHCWEGGSTWGGGREEEGEEEEEDGRRKGRRKRRVKGWGEGCEL